MIVFSHIEVGNYYFHTIKNNNELSFRLRWSAFVYGNVFPDISKFASRKHFYETTRSVYTCYLKKARNPDNNDRERSMALGVVCHFLCDYFCKYHAKSPYTSHSMVRHTLYELFLHMKIRILLFRKFFGQLESGEQGIFIAVDRNQKDGDFDLQKMIMDYEDEDESLQTDIKYAFESVRRIMAVTLGEEVVVSNIKTGEDTSPYCRVPA